MVSSSIKGEGKTTISTNTALALAQNRKKYAFDWGRFKKSSIKKNLQVMLKEGCQIFSV